MFDAKRDIHSDRYNFFLAGTDLRWLKYVLLLVTSPHRRRADGQQFYTLTGEEYIMQPHYKRPELSL